MEASYEDLCEGHPQEFAMYLNYCRSLEFADEPDYAKCLGLFHNCFQRLKLDSNKLEYAWSKNALKSDRDSLKAQMMGSLKNGKANQQEK